MRILVLGAGFGGLELTSRLSEEFGEDISITLIDKSDGFVFGFSKLDVMFGRNNPAEVRHLYKNIVKPGVQFVSAEITSIDPVAKKVIADGIEYFADILVVALGADLVPEQTPGLLAAGYEFYTVQGAFDLAPVIENFSGGIIVVGVTSTPFKCPPAPSETVLLLDDFYSTKGIRDKCEISLVMPFGVPIPPSPDASAKILQAFEERDIAWIGDTVVESLDPDRKVAKLSNGSEISFDLFLGVPIHRAPSVVVESGLTVDGWIPVNSLTLETSFADVYAVGDVTSVGTPKAGVFAEGQAGVVANRIIEQIKGKNLTSEYDGRGMCYLEFGHDQVGRVEVTFLSGERPTGALEGPSVDFVKDKKHFGSSRIQRWFG